MSFSSLWTDTGSSLEKVIWAIFIGIVIAAFVLWYQKSYLGRVARWLYKKEIDSAEKAVSLSQMGMNSFFIRRELKNRYSALRKVVYCTNGAERLKDSDFTDARFYIPAEQRNRAYFKYRGNNTTLPVVIITIVIMFIMANLCIEYVPSILELLKK